MRFDDSLETVLTADMSTPFGAQTAWRQLVDLIGRGRAPASEMAMARLRSIRPQVPSPIRAASARALAFARPPAPLVRLFAEEDLAIAAPVLRMADLRSDEWIAMLPEMAPAARSVLRHRRDLPAEVTRALETFGPIDFILPGSPVAESVFTAVPTPSTSFDVQPEPVVAAAEDPAAAEKVAESVAEPVPDVGNSAPVEVESYDAPLEPVEQLPDADLLPLPISALPTEAEAVRAVAPLMRAPAEMGDLGEAGVQPAEMAAPALEVAASVERIAAEPAPEPAPEPDPDPDPDPDLVIAVPPALVFEPALVSEPAIVEEPLSIDWTSVIAARPAPAPIVNRAPKGPNLVPAVTAPPAVPLDLLPVSPVVEPAPVLSADTASDWSFVSIASVAFGLPVVVEAMRHQDDTVLDDAAPVIGQASDVSADSDPTPDAPVQIDPLLKSEPALDSGALALVETESTVAAAGDETTEGTPAPLPLDAGDAESAAPRGPFQISDLVARIDAFNRQREETGREDDGTVIANDLGAQSTVRQGFRFETDAAGTIRWVEGVSRAAVIGVSLDLVSGTDAPKVDGVATGAYRRRSTIANARLLIDGQSDAAGQWRISGVPVFDRASGRFTGYRGTARRPRADERAEPDYGDRSPAIDSLRQLVHELRTPTTAIAGFAEMIEGELLGPVPGPYRDYAETIRDQAMGLLGAIDDLDMAARIEAQALDLRPTDLPVGLLLQRIVHDLAPLATLRQATILLDIDAGDVSIKGDDRAVDRLFTRLFAALVSAGSAGETIAIRLGREGEDTVAVHVGRPRALAGYPGDALFAIDAESEAEIEGAPLLGTGFALRLARNLAVELGGSLTIGVDRLTLRLPAAFTHGVGQVSTI